ncbi:hypothetical protein [Aeromonas sanarellii]|uniref:hypothetical protein n=1 Tax=Aeromonas sanarellii TaxID=633415 RepID=UPI0038D1EB07
MNEETSATVVAAPKKRGRPVKDSTISLTLKPLPSVRLAKEQALQYLIAYVELPWSQENISYKLKANQLLLQHLDTFEDKVVSEQKDEVTNTTKVPSPDFEEVGIDSLSPEQFAAYQKAFGKKS